MSFIKPVISLTFDFASCRYADSICLRFYERSTINQSSDSYSLENQSYDFCNCINVSYTPRQIISANNFVQVRFKTVPRLDSDNLALIQSRSHFRGYLIRYRFTTDFGLDLREGGRLEPNAGCTVNFHSADKRSGYFSSPNYPGLYPRDVKCDYNFYGLRNEKVQITFHTFDIEGVGQ